MEIAELLKSSVITGIELHAGCLLIVAILFVNMRKSFSRNSRKSEMSINIVYIGIALMIISDCIWTTVSSLEKPGDIIAYIINLVYFLSSSAASAYWFLFCTNHLDTRFHVSRGLRVAAMLPYAAMTVIYMLSPGFGFIFKVNSGEYIRGDLFWLDPAVKIGYVAASAVLAFVCGGKKKVGYLRKNDLYYALFAVPVILCGILQVIIGVDFNCLGASFALILIYITGITNPDSENTDALYSLANSFEASYIVNMDTGLIRPLRQDVMHESNMTGMDSLNFTEHFSVVLAQILLPEDKQSTLEAFSFKNIEKRFEIDTSFSIRYRVKEASGLTSIHTASFIRAAGGGRREFLLGINSINTDSLLYERNEILSHENERLEQINTGIIDSVAKIVEARDSGSGGHIVRVKKLTEILAREIMKDCPGYNLNEDSIKLISSASVLHDVGKIVIPDSVLLKPGKLTPEEFEIMKTHSAKGCDILNFFPLGLDDAFLECALSICRWHHERFDGSGYPDGLKGNDIPIAAQIVSVADCFDALVSDRPYKKAIAPEKAFDMIISGECGLFSPEIISSLNKHKNRFTELSRLYR